MKKVDEEELKKAREEVKIAMEKYNKKLKEKSKNLTKFLNALNRTHGNILDEETGVDLAIELAKLIFPNPYDKPMPMPMTNDEELIKKIGRRHLPPRVVIDIDEIYQKWIKVEFGKSPSGFDLEKIDGAKMFKKFIEES